jgi:hypothetical protein
VAEPALLAAEVEHSRVATSLSERSANEEFDHFQAGGVHACEFTAGIDRHVGRQLQLVHPGNTRNALSLKVRVERSQQRRPASQQSLSGIRGLAA